MGECQFPVGSVCEWNQDSWCFQSTKRKTVHVVLQCNWVAWPKLNGLIASYNPIHMVPDIGWRQIGGVFLCSVWISQIVWFLFIWLSVFLFSFSRLFLFYSKGPKAPGLGLAGDTLGYKKKTSKRPYFFRKRLVRYFHRKSFEVFVVNSFVIWIGGSLTC